MVFYRKYRPQKLEDLDLVSVRESLTKVLSSSFKPHAYLFCGPKGTGKTSAARIVAKILNCENINTAKTIDPCNQCETCISITEGNNIDILEIDAASNRGIDEIRDLREKIKLTPIAAKFKIYIIDEVHMLTNEAFNALLKTLEEPPAHAVFILATTEYEKLPQTIVSRCHKFLFQKASTQELVHSLKRVVTGEKLKIPDEVLVKIALSADGSFRDGTKILQQSVLEDALDIAKIDKFLGLDSQKTEEFLDLLANKKTRDLLENIQKLVLNGADLKIFVAELLKLLHDILLSIHGVELSGKINPALKDKFDKKDLNQLIKILAKVYLDLKFSASPELIFEVAVVEWCEGKL